MHRLLDFDLSRRFRSLLRVGLVAAPLATALVVQPAGAQELATITPSAHWDAAIDAGRATVAEVMEANGIPGMSVAVLVDGQIAWSEGFGFADIENRVPVTPLTRMRIGSVSKPVTAAALGVLIEHGRIDLDAPVQRYVPSFPEKRWPITTRQLAGHQAGIRHYRGDEFLARDRYDTVLEGLQIFQNDSLLFEPGTDYEYSTYGWNLVSAVIEGASGTPFLQFMQQEVFEPLGLRSLVPGHIDSIIPYRASFYERAGNTTALVNAPYVDNSYKWAGGGFVSNTEDLVRFGWAHLAGDFLDDATITTLFTAQRTRSGEDTGYGLGWATGEDGAGRRTISHGGSSVGGRAMLVLYPEQRVVVAMLANAGFAPMTGELAERLAAPFMEQAR